MENFTREQNGYSPREVEEYLQRIRLENETRSRRQNERMETMKHESVDLKNKIEIYKRREEQISKALVMAVKKSSEIEKSASAVYELELKRVQLLYRKWESLLNELRQKFGTAFPNGEIDDLVGDFQYALTITLETQQTPDGGRTYSQSVLEKMQHKIPTVNAVGKLDPSIALKETEVKVQYDEEGHRLQSVTEHSKFTPPESSGKTPAERFLSGENINLPESMGKTGPDLLFPPKEFTDALNESESGFSLKNALTPKESLEEIMRAFNLGDIEKEEEQQEN